jgi:hypothetical protein
LRIDCRSAGHLDLGDALNGHKDPAEGDAVGRHADCGSNDLNVFEASQANEMVDGLTHMLHRQWLADACFDQLKHRGLERGDTADFHTDIAQGSPEKIVNVSVSEGGSEDDRDDGQATDD